MVKKRKSPFKPGAGKIPPVRAGHQDAVRDLFERVDDVGNREEGDTVVLYGPRGTGKTTLLEEVRARAVSRGAKVRWLVPGDWEDSVDDFVRGLPDGIVDESDGNVQAEINLGFLKVGVGRRLKAPRRLIEKTLRVLSTAMPLVLLVDEAHELPPKIAKALLNAAQRCITSGLPLLLVLAGTPGLRASLGRAGASFWERSHRLRIGRLESQDAVRDALATPAARRGLPFADDALEWLMAESQGYPYFIQLVGGRSWEAAIKRDPGADRILLEDAQAGVRAANRQRNELYADRVREINSRNILSEARAVSKAFHAIGGDGVLPEAELEAALEPALTGDRDMYDALEELFTVGLIWQTDDHAFWEPGIPSLCTYIVERRKTKTR